MSKLLGLGLPVLLATSVLVAEIQVGGKVADFQLRDVSGQSVDYASLRGATTVVTFVATQCPVSNDYNERMNAVYRDYTSKGVKFVFINSNSTEPADQVAEHSKKVGFAFPVYKDERNVVADRFGAQVTPESFVFGEDGTLLYHGSIDDSRNASRIQFQGLRAALDSVLAGKAVARSETKAFGCTIKRVR